MILTLIKIYFAGVGILVGAIIANFVAKLLHLQTWYDFLKEPRYDIATIIWLFILYPIILGLCAYTVQKIF